MVFLMFQVTFTTLTCVLILCHSTNQHVRLICQCHVLSRYFVILFSSFTFLSSIFTTWSRINSLSDGCQQRWQSTLFISDKIYKSVYPSCQVLAYVQALFLSFSLSHLISGVSHLSLSCVSALCLLSLFSLLSSAVSQMCLSDVSVMSQQCLSCVFTVFVLSSVSLLSLSCLSAVSQLSLSCL